MTTLNSVFKKLWNLTLCLLLGHQPGDTEVAGIYFSARYTSTRCRRCGTELIC